MSLIHSTLFEFFVDLRQNNTRDWFKDNKQRYDSIVKEPLLQFITEFRVPLATISPHFSAIPRVGGSLFRIYRDTRFSKDKSPYKTAAGVHFRHEAGKSVHAPGFYLHLAPHEVFAAIGIWGPDVPTLTKLRQAIVEHDEVWARVISDPTFCSVYQRSLQGNELKRAPRGFDPHHLFVEDLKRRHLVAVATLSEADACRPDFMERLANTYRAGAEFMEFVTRAIDLAW